MPIVPSPSWSGCLPFSRDVANALVAIDASVYTTNFRKLAEKILIDYLRNNRTKTSICAYFPRARAGTPVSMPITWRDLRAVSKPQSLPRVWKALPRRRIDPWHKYGMPTARTAILYFLGRRHTARSRS